MKLRSCSSRSSFSGRPSPPSVTAAAHLGLYSIGPFRAWKISHFWSTIRSGPGNNSGSLISGNSCVRTRRFKGAFHTMKKLLALLFAVALSISMSSFAFSQDKMSDDKKADKKEDKMAKKDKKEHKKKEKKEKKDEMKKDEAK